MPPATRTNTPRHRDDLTYEEKRLLKQRRLVADFEETNLTEAMAEVMDPIRDKFKELVILMLETLPESRELSRATNSLDDAMSLCERALSRRAVDLD